MAGNQVFTKLFFRQPNLLGFKPSSITMTVSKSDKNLMISFSHYCFRNSLTFVSLFGCRDSIPTKTAQLLFAQFQGREVEKIATESSHEYQTVSVHPAGGDSRCDGFQMYLGGFPFDSLNSNLIHPIFCGIFICNEENTKHGVKCSTKITQKQQTCDFIQWSNYPMMYCTKF